MERYFNLSYEFSKGAVHEAIDAQLGRLEPGYICVADGVVLDIANRNPDYLKVVNGSMFCICDSSFVPLYIKWLYGRKVDQYCGSQIFKDIVSMRRHRMIFLGGSRAVLDGLRNKLKEMNPDIPSMKFVELPFLSVDKFDYPAIAQMIADDGADIVWVALGAPKQEIFMSKLKPHLRRGVMIGVGAAFKFFSGTEVSRAPRWMGRNHLEFVHRIYKEPKKQISRCANIVRTLPILLMKEWKVSRSRKS